MAMKVRQGQSERGEVSGVAVSDIIEAFLLDRIREMGGVTELRRGELAERFSCVPSQINYVLATRFSPEHGFFVESRRGGGGYVRITRVTADPRALLMHTVNTIGTRIDAHSAEALLKNLRAEEILDARELRLMSAAVGDAALRSVPAPLKDAVRADILKQCLIRCDKRL